MRRSSVGASKPTNPIGYIPPPTEHLKQGHADTVSFEPVSGQSNQSNRNAQRKQTIIATGVGAGIVLTSGALTLWFSSAVAVHLIWAGVVLVAIAIIAILVFLGASAAATTGKGMANSLHVLAMVLALAAIPASGIIYALTAPVVQTRMQNATGIEIPGDVKRFSSVSASAVATGNSPPTPERDSGPCSGTHLLISEIRTRGLNGGGDEFVELYNPTDQIVRLDASWSIQGRASNNAGYTTRFTGPSRAVAIPAHGHYLIAGVDYDQAPLADGMLSASIVDSGSILLVKDNSPIDAVCYRVGAVEWSPGPGYICEGELVLNPHDDSSATNTDSSIERVGKSCQDTNNNNVDFRSIVPSNPQGLSGTKTPPD